MPATKKFGFEINRMRLGTVPYSQGQRQELALEGGIPKDYYLAGLLFRLRYRVAISGGTTNGTITAEAGQNLIERIEISGEHKALGNQIRFLLQGGHVYQRGNIFNGTVHERTGVPASGAAANSDISVTLRLDLIPPMVRPEEQLLYLLDPPAWNTLQLYVDWGGPGSIVSGGDRTVAIQGFGGAGNVDLTVTRLIVKLGTDRFKLAPIPVRTTYRTKKLETAIADDTVDEIKVGNFLRSLMLVTGTRATGGSLAVQGDNFLSLSDAIYSRVKIKRDENVQRDVEWVPNQQLESAKKRFPATWPTGYNLIDFVEDETVATAYDTRALALQNLRFELTGNTTGVAEQRLHVVHDELAGIPVFK